MSPLYKSLDIFFFVFHVALIFFNLFGWIFKPTRKWNLITLGLTAFSWFALGIFYGLGYCFLTDWHWSVRDKLGYETGSDSYIHFLVTKLTGISVSENTLDVLTVVFFFSALIISAVLNIRDYRHRRKA